MNNLPKIKRDDTNDEEHLRRSSDLSPNKQKIQNYDYFSAKIPKNIIEGLLKLERDERFTYFIKFGTLRRYEGDGDIIFVEIPQIPKKIVVYRRPSNRQKTYDRLYLNNLDLPHIPLFEGEENLKLLSLENNFITKIDHLVSLNNLLYLNLYANKILEIENLHSVSKLRALMLGKNYIEKIKNLHYMPDLEVLDLHSNKIKSIENLSFLKKLRLLNLANNQISNFNDLIQNRNLEELNLRKNLIVGVPFQINCFDKLRKLNLGRNMISKIDHLIELKKIKHLSELIIEDNPVLVLREAIELTKSLPIKLKQSKENKKQLTFPIEETSNMNMTLVNKFDKENMVKNDHIETKLSSNALFHNTNQTSSNINIQVNSYEANESKGKIEDQSISIIKHIEKEWMQELAFIKKNGFNGYNCKKLKETKIVSGHAELEGPYKLNIYGNALEVLDQKEFYDNINEIHFEYFNFDLISKKKNLDKLKNYKTLLRISFSNNNLHSFYQIIKFEDFSSIVAISIKNNEVVFSNMLKYFCIYRFQNLKTFNNSDIFQKDITLAKNFFEYFDKCISISENQKEEHKQRKNSLNFLKNNETYENHIDQVNLKDKLMEYFYDNIISTVDEMIENDENPPKE